MLAKISVRQARRLEVLALRREALLGDVRPKSCWFLAGRKIAKKRHTCNFAPFVYAVPMKEPKNKSSIGSRIKAARKSNQLTTAQLSRRLGVQTKTLASWQNNLTQPRSNRLAMLAGVLGVTPRWLLVGKGWGPLHRSFF